MFTAHTHPFNGHLSRTTRVSRYQKGKPIWILLKQETVSGSGICWAICKSAPCSRQITTPALHHSVFLQARCSSCRPTNSVKALKAVLAYQPVYPATCLLLTTIEIHMLNRTIQCYQPVHPATTCLLLSTDHYSSFQPPDKLGI